MGVLSTLVSTNVLYLMWVLIEEGRVNALLCIISTAWVLIDKCNFSEVYGLAIRESLHCVCRKVLMPAWIAGHWDKCSKHLAPGKSCWRSLTLTSEETFSSKDEEWGSIAFMVSLCQGLSICYRRQGLHWSFLPVVIYSLLSASAKEEDEESRYFVIFQYIWTVSHFLLNKKANSYCLQYCPLHFATLGEVSASPWGERVGRIEFGTVSECCFFLSSSFISYGVCPLE